MTDAPLLAYIERSIASERRYPNGPGFIERGSTSEKAARKAARFDKPLRFQCLEILTSGDFAPGQIAERLGLKDTQVRPRMSQLFAKKFIAVVGEWINGSSNAEHVYRITALGREALHEHRSKTIGAA